MGWSRGAVVLTAAVLLLAGCAEDPQPRAAPELELSAAAGQSRTARSQGKLDLELRNTGPTDVTLDTLQIRSPLFEVVSPVERETVIRAGDLGTLFLTFGKADCSVTDGSGAQVVVGVRTDDGVREVAVPLEDREPGLARAHRLACAAEAVREQASIELGPQLTRTTAEGRPALVTELRLTRRGDQQVRVASIGSNILFTPTTRGTDPVVVLPADQQSVAVPVVIAATRCDPHALTESKASFTFPVYASAGGSEEAFLQVTVEEPGRAALLALVDEVCIQGRDSGSTSPGDTGGS